MIGKLFLILILVLSVLSSCDEVHVAPTPEPVDLLPLSIGNYWIFDTYSLDQAGNPIGGTNAADSIVAENKDSLLGKEAYYLVRYRDSERFDTMIVAKNAKLVYMLYDEKNSGIPGLERQWFPIADLVNEFWHVYTVQKSYFPYIFNGENVVSTADYNMNEYRQAADSIDIPSAGRFYRMEFYLKTDIRIRFTYKFAGEDDSSTVERTQLQYHRISFADKVGFLMIKDDPYFYKITSTSIHYKGESKNYNGTRSDMKRYGVK
jgi:hypothetical protein